MDVFEFLKEDKARIAERLTQTSRNYPDWSWDRIYEETKKSLEGVRQHLKKESLLMSNLKSDEGLENILDEASKKREEMNSEIENLVMIHVDEPGFEQGLDSIAGKLREYNEFCADRLYPELKDHLSEDDVKHVNEQLDDIVMS